MKAKPAEVKCQLPTLQYRKQHDDTRKKSKPPQQNIWAPRSFVEQHGLFTDWAQAYQHDIGKSKGIARLRRAIDYKEQERYNA